MKGEDYAPGFVSLNLMVSEKEYHVVGGERVEGDPSADLPYVGVARLESIFQNKLYSKFRQAAADVVKPELEKLYYENFMLRSMLAMSYSAGLLYKDDGELQDNREHPCIDFKRDSVDEIQRKMGVRMMNALKKAGIDPLTLQPTGEKKDEKD